MGFFLTNGFLNKCNLLYGPYRKILNSKLSVLFLDDRGINHTLEQKLNLPEKPKRPLTPFLRFMIQVRPSFVKQYPDLKLTELTKKISQQWEKCDPKIKTDLESQYRKDKELYDVAKLKYESSLSNDQKQIIEQEKIRTVENKEKRRLKKKAQEFEKPKRPPSSYMIFAVSRISSRGNKPVTEWQKLIGKEWKNLDESEKKKYVNEAKERSDKYSKELVLWEEKMFNLGHVDLLRTESLVPKTKSKK